MTAVGLGQHGSEAVGPGFESLSYWPAPGKQEAKESWGRVGRFKVRASQQKN